MSDGANGAVTADPFERTKLLLGEAAFQRIANSFVVVVGLGAVGSYAAEALARAGVGRLRLVDRDVVQVSNVNRQLYALNSTVGQPKADCAAKRVRDINPTCSVEGTVLDVSSATVSQVIGGEPDGLIDAIDDIPAKVALLMAAHDIGIHPVLSAMGAATRMDPTLVAVAPLEETTHCPLARQLRQRLRQEGHIDGTKPSGIRCVFSTEVARNRFMSAKPNGLLTPMGSFSCLPAIFGLHAAQDLLRHLIGRTAGGEK